MNTSNSGQPWFVDPLALRRSVSAYPSLQAALFPPPLTSLSPAHSQDISVYQLLQVSITQYTLAQVSIPNYRGMYRSTSLGCSSGRVQIDPDMRRVLPVGVACIIVSIVSYRELQ